MRNRSSSGGPSRRFDPSVAAEDGLADRIANGQEPFPTNLDLSEASRLADEVQGRLRARLVDFVAQAIASALLANEKESPEC